METKNVPNETWRILNTWETNLSFSRNFSKETFWLGSRTRLKNGKKH